MSEYALVAARRAAALESNREAYFHYRRAADFAERMPALDQADLLEELATAAYLVGRLDDAFEAIEGAIEIHRELGDQAAVGRCTRVLSRLHWFVGDGAPARAKALEAITILEPLGESIELARACSGVAQLAMLARGRRAGAQVGRAGARSRDSARRREHPRARAREHRLHQGAARSRRDRRPARGARACRRRRRARGRDSRPRQPRLRPHVLGACPTGAAVRAAGARLRRDATRCTRTSRT